MQNARIVSSWIDGSSSGCTNDPMTSISFANESVGWKYTLSEIFTCAQHASMAARPASHLDF